jgi:hypothetical protein
MQAPFFSDVAGIRNHLVYNYIEALRFHFLGIVMF